MSTKHRDKKELASPGWLRNRWDSEGVLFDGHGNPIGRKSNYWECCPTVQTWGAWPTSQYYETITTSDTQKGFKNCSHVSFRGLTSKSPTHIWRNDYWWENAPTGYGQRRYGRDIVKSRGYWDYLFHRVGVQAPYPGYNDDWTLPSTRAALASLASRYCPDLPDTVENLCARALRSIAPAIESELSSIVTLSELGDIKSLVTQPIKILRSIERFAKGRSLKTLADLMREVAGGHLTYVFGWKPTKSDILGIYSAVLNTQRKIDELFDGVGKRQTRRWTVRIDPVSAVSSLEGYSDMNWSCQFRDNIQGTTKFNVTVRFYYTLVDALGNPMNRAGADLAGWLDALGVNLNPAIIWDKIPFSFVLDWFVGVGDWLDSFKRRNINPVVTVEDCCYSIKRECKIRRNSDITAYRSGGPNRQVTSADFVYREYTRNVFVPKATWLHGEELDISLPSLKQWCIGASLIMANTRRR